jgi:hypothetical protein
VSDLQNAANLHRLFAMSCKVAKGDREVGLKLLALRLVRERLEDADALKEYLAICANRTDAGTLSGQRPPAPRRVRLNPAVWRVVGFPLRPNEH